MNHYDIGLYKADRLAESQGAKYYYDYMLYSNYYSRHEPRRPFRATRYYFASTDIDEGFCLQELGHYSQLMNVYTEIKRPHWIKYVDRNEHDRYSTELQAMA